MNRKLTALLLTLAMVLSLAACSSKEEAPAPAPVPEVETPTQQPEIETPAEPEQPEEAPAPEVEPEEPAEPEQKPAEKPAEPAPEQKPAETPAAPAGNADLEAFYNGLYEKLYPLDSEGFATGPFVQDLAVMPELLENYYPGLAPLCKQVHVYMPGMSGVPYEVVLLETNSAADVEAVKAILQARVDTELSNLMNYPMVLENWELNSEIIVNGNFVMMAVTEDHAAYVEAFNAL